MKYLPQLARSAHSSQLLEIFFVASVSSVLLIRGFLSLTGYPQIAGGGFHIAHMLWGGILMGAAVMVSLSFLGRPTQYTSAILGGVGFGVFIDEVGKFITVDNDYFFRPSAAIIYVMFVVVFLIIRQLSGPRQLTHTEAVMNALDITKEIARKDLSETEHRQLIYYLSLARLDDPIVRALLKVSRQVKPLPDSPSVIQRAILLSTAKYRELVHTAWFDTLIIAIFLTQAIVSFAYIVTRASGNEVVLDIVKDVPLAMGVDLLSSVVSLCIIGMGAWYMRRSRMTAYQWFARALVFDILVTQVFLFYHEQFSAIVGVFFKIILLIGVQYAVNRERLTSDGENRI